MSKLTTLELNLAFKNWYSSYAFKDADTSIEPFLNQNIKNENESWLKKARQALFLSTGEMAKRLQISRAAYSKYEEGEELGTLSIQNLAKAAEAMDCELIYVIRPKSKELFSTRIWNTLLKASLSNSWIRNCDQRRRANALAAVAKRQMNNPQFRKEQLWSQRANSVE